MSQRYFLTTESTYEALRLAVDGDLGYPTSTASSIFTPALQAPRDSLRRIVLAVDDSLPGYAKIVARVTPLLANSSAQELTEAEYLAFLTCVPSTADLPQPHAATHATGGSDALSPSDIGAAAVSHTHTAAAISDFASAVAAASPEEVVEFLTPADFPATGNSSLLYIATDDGRAYRWVGSQYAEVGTGAIQTGGAVRSDTVGSTSYIGRAVAGSATSASVWTIRRTVLTSAGAVSATTTATNVKWDDRLTASYS